MVNAPVENIKLGVLFALIAALSYTIMSVFVKLLGNGQSTASVVFFRFAIGLLVLLPWLLTDKNLFKIDHKIKVVLRCATSIVAMACVFYSLKFMPVANVLLLNNTFPLFLPLLAWMLLKVKTPIKMLMGIFIGFFGVALILHPTGNSFNWHSLIALLSGLLAALATLQIRLLTKGSSAKQILFCLFVFGTVVSGVVMVFSFKMPSGHEMILLFLVGFFGAIYQLFLTLALEVAKARIVSPIYFSCILFSGIIDWILWSVKPGVIELAGMGLIIIGGIVAILMAPKTKALPFLHP